MAEMFCDKTPKGKKRLDKMWRNNLLEKNMESQEVGIGGVNMVSLKVQKEVHWGRGRSPRNAGMSLNT